METSLALLQDTTQYEERRKFFEDLASKMQSEPTPTNMREKRSDGFEYPLFPYMLAQMNKYHPRRTEIPYQILLDDKAGVVTIAVIVTDIETGESRTGIDSHRITFKKGEKKSLDSVVDIGNDMKSALTEALRNGYSRFGCCADVYGKIMPMPTTPDQVARFNRIIEEIVRLKGIADAEFSASAGDVRAKDWSDISKRCVGFRVNNEATFKKQLQSNADEYLTKLEAQLKNIKKEYFNAE